MLSSSKALEELDKEFSRNSDRGVAIVSASILDGILKELLGCVDIWAERPKRLN